MHLTSSLSATAATGMTRKYDKSARVLAVGAWLFAAAMANGADLMGTKDAGGGGSADVGRVVEIAKKVELWFNTNGNRYPGLDEGKYHEVVADLEKSVMKGEITRITFVPNEPVDSAGNRKPGVFFFEPFPRIEFWQVAWSNWIEHRDFEAIYNQVALEALGLALVRETDRYAIAADVAREWKSIDEQRLAPLSAAIDTGVVVMWEDHRGEDVLIAKGIPGNDKKIWPPRTIMAARLEAVIGVLEKFRNSEKALSAYGSSDETCPISITETAPAVYEVWFDARCGTEHAAEDRGWLALESADAGRFGFRFRGLDRKSTLVELLPGSRFFGPIDADEAEWLASNESGRPAYTFYAHVPHKGALLLELEIHGAQRQRQRRLSLSYVHRWLDRPSAFEIRATLREGDRTRSALYTESCNAKLSDDAARVKRSTCPGALAPED